MVPAANSASQPLVMLVLPVLQPAGAERVVAELAKRLPAHGFTTRVLCLEDERAPIGLELAEAGVVVEGLRLSRRRTLACARALAGRLPAQRPLILHGHLFHANMAVRLARTQLSPEARRDVCVISTVQVVERRFRPWQFALDRWTAGHCCAEVCVSEDVRRFQQRKTRLPERFFRVIENAVDLKRFAPGAAGSGLRSEAPHVLAIGRLDPQKDYPTLLRAWQLVSAARPGARLTIAGSGSQRDRLESLGRALGLSNVQFVGFVSDVPALLRGADLFVQSSRWEGLPLSVIEAMSAGVPVIATYAEGTRNVVDHERTGLLVPRSDPKAFAEAILASMADPGRAMARAAAARTEALARFSVDQMVEKYAALYREVCPGLR